MRGDMDLLGGEGPRPSDAIDALVYAVAAHRGAVVAARAPWTIWDLPGAPKAPAPKVDWTPGKMHISNTHPRPVIDPTWVATSQQPPVPAPAAPKPPGPEDEWMRRWLRRR